MNLKKVKVVNEPFSYQNLKAVIEPTQVTDVMIIGSAQVIPYPISYQSNKFKLHAESRTSGIDESNHNRKKGMVLPFEPRSITFDNVMYSVDMPQVSKVRKMEQFHSSIEADLTLIS